MYMVKLVRKHFESFRKLIFEERDLGGLLLLIYLRVLVILVSETAQGKKCYEQNVKRILYEKEKLDYVFVSVTPHSNHQSLLLPPKSSIFPFFQCLCFCLPSAIEDTMSITQNSPPTYLPSSLNIFLLHPRLLTRLLPHFCIIIAIRLLAGNLVRVNVEAHLNPTNPTPPPPPSPHYSYRIIPNLVPFSALFGHHQVLGLAAHAVPVVLRNSLRVEWEHFESLRVLYHEVE